MTMVKSEKSAGIEPSFFCEAILSDGGRRDADKGKTMNSCPRRSARILSKTADGGRPNPNETFNLDDLIEVIVDDDTTFIRIDEEDEIVAGETHPVKKVIDFSPEVLQRWSLSMKEAGFADDSGFASYLLDLEKNCKSKLETSHTGVSSGPTLPAPGKPIAGKRTSSHQAGLKVKRTVAKRTDGSSHQSPLSQQLILHRGEHTRQDFSKFYLKWREKQEHAHSHTRKDKQRVGLTMSDQKSFSIEKRRRRPTSNTDFFYYPVVKRPKFSRHNFPTEDENSSDSTKENKLTKDSFTLVKVCPFCYFVFNSVVDSTHLKTHDNFFNSDGLCSLCNKMNIDDLLSHVVSHITECFQCKKCAKVYPTARCLGNHECDDDGAKGLSLDVVRSSEYSEKVGFSVFELKNRRVFRCCSCGIKRGLIQQVQNHLNDVHGRVLTVVDFGCELCGDTFEDKEELGKHLSDLHQV